MHSRFQLAGQRVLVTGASGFIGTHLCNRLLAAGADVHGGCRRERSSLDDRVRWWTGDLSDQARARAILGAVKPDVIVHLAGEATGAPDLEFVASTLRNNLVATVNVLTLATELGCRRIVLAGSSDEPESTEFIPSPYAASKIAVSLYARMFCTLYNAPVVMARMCFLYGPGQDRRKLIPYVIDSLLQGLDPRLASGHLDVDWIYVNDAVDGLMAAATVAGLEGRTVEIGSGALVSIRALVERLVTMIDPSRSPQFGALPDRPFETAIAQKADVAATYAISGWRPSVSLEEGLAMTIAWCRHSLVDVERGTSHV